MYVPGSDDVLRISVLLQSELEKITFKCANDPEEDKSGLPSGLLDCINLGSSYTVILDKYSISNMTNDKLFQRSWQLIPWDCNYSDLQIPHKIPNSRTWTYPDHWSLIPDSI